MRRLDAQRCADFEFSGLLAPARHSTALDLHRFAVGQCKENSCKQTIEKGALRIGKSFPSPFGDADMTNWFVDMTNWYCVANKEQRLLLDDSCAFFSFRYHAICMFQSLSRARKTTKKIESEDDLEGWDDIKEADKKLLRKLIGGEVMWDAPKKKAASKRKSKKDESEEEDDDDDEKPAKKQATAKKKPAAKKRGKKDEDEDEDEEEENEEEEDESKDKDEDVKMTDASAVFEGLPSSLPSLPFPSNPFFVAQAKRWWSPAPSPSPRKK